MPKVIWSRKRQKQNLSELRACALNHYDGSVNMRSREIYRKRKEYVKKPEDEMLILLQIL